MRGHPKNTQRKRIDPQQSPKVILQHQKRQRIQKSPKKNDRTSALVNLDEVSEAEEDYPDDTAEEEELRKRQAASKERQLAKEREERRSREREERERRSRSSSSSSRGGGGTRRTKEETVEVDVKELVTLDEKKKRRRRKEEDGKAERSTPETRPPSQDDESGDSLNPETLVTLDEAGGDEEEKPDEERAEKSSRSAKRKNDEQHRGIDELCDGRRGGRGRGGGRGRLNTQDKRPSQEENQTDPWFPSRVRSTNLSSFTTVRKSTRGKKVTTKDKREEEEKELSGADVPPLASLHPSTSSDKDLSMLSSDARPEVQKAEEEAPSQSVDAASAGQELQPELSENRTLGDSCGGRQGEGQTEQDGTLKIVSFSSVVVNGGGVNGGGSSSDLKPSDLVLSLLVSPPTSNCRRSNPTTPSVRSLWCLNQGFSVTCARPVLDFLPERESCRQGPPLQQPETLRQPAVFFVLFGLKPECLT
ncbi:hypothetical protein L3Q82_003962 [Scortum barcoo]|uniref:Uncharacterized protein n=1 Tax=Scortum barcoo TaxID=214431 RepID=A0ACB8X6A9_9TELE|nr:hypothetical protein L3Q82_003962 [Scortum barcoo]